jgi:hypothetical protein
MSERSKPPLAMNYSRTEGGLVIRLDGASPSDGSLIADAISQDILDELDRRGYDLNSLRFSIRKKKEDLG